MELDIYTFGKAFAKGFGALGYIDLSFGDNHYVFSRQSSLTGISFPNIKAVDDRTIYHFFIEHLLPHSNRIAVYIHKVYNGFEVNVGAKNEKTLNRFIDYTRMRYRDLEYRRVGEFSAIYNIPYDKAADICVSVKLSGEN